MNVSRRKDERHYTLRGGKGMRVLIRHAFHLPNKSTCFLAITLALFDVGGGIAHQFKYRYMPCLCNGRHLWPE